MKAWLKRLLIAFVVAWFLPFPGPHIDEYIPLIATLLHDPSGADWGFYAILVGAVVVYTLGIFGILSIVAKLRSRREKT